MTGSRHSVATDPGRRPQVFRRAITAPQWQTIEPGKIYFEDDTGQNAGGITSRSSSNLHAA